MRNKYTKELIQPLIENSKTWADVCRSLGIKPSSGSQSYLKIRVDSFNIDYSHFIGQAHAKGKSFKKRDALEYCFDGSNEGSHRLKLRLIRDGYKSNNCEKCGLSKWLGEDLVLELDHINSNHFDNRLENLQILCPNCHALKIRNRKKGIVEMVANSDLESDANKVA